MATIEIPHPAIPAPAVIYALGKYRPYWYHRQNGGDGQSFPTHSGRLLDLKEARESGLSFCLKVLTDEIKATIPLALAAVPSSDAAKLRSGVQQLVTRFAPVIGGLDLGNLLLRTTSIPKLAKGGDRSIGVHLASIAANDVSRTQGRVVMLFDDIVTTGNSLAAARQILLDAGVAEVICIALGQTSYD